MTEREHEAAEVLINAFEWCEFAASSKEWMLLHPTKRSDPMYASAGVLVHHPTLTANGGKFLIAIVSVRDGDLKITYCVEAYRMGIEYVVKNAISTIEKGPRKL